ncbi:MAG: hypothetical protein JJ964_02840 [Rhizobiales bacterium]|nr:hypothetical protein [Hyphomicrobiales bacterium]
MDQVKENQINEQAASGGCCCSSKKQAKPEVEVKKETKPSCCTKTEDEKEYPMSNTAD